MLPPHTGKSVPDDLLMMPRVALFVAHSEAHRSTHERLPDRHSDEARDTKLGRDLALAIIGQLGVALVHHLHGGRCIVEDATALFEFADSGVAFERLRIGRWDRLVHLPDAGSAVLGIGVQQSL